MKSNSSPAEGLWLSPDIIQLHRVPAEKMLLAYLCQQAAGNDDVCTDSNKELAEALMMNVKTVSDLISKLSKDALIETTVDKQQANKRILTPLASLMPPYPEKPDSPVTPYPEKPDRGATMPTAVASQPERRQRICPITNLDITHQRPECQHASHRTLTILSQRDAPAFHELANRFFKPGEWKAPYLLVERVRLLADRIHRLSKARQYQPGAVSRTDRARRLCPVSGIDLTHQGMNYPLATADTIKRLFKADRPQFDAVLARLGLSLPADTPMSTQCMRVHGQIGRLAETKK